VADVSALAQIGFYYPEELPIFVFGPAEQN
jgi:hypothetical protein